MTNSWALPPENDPNAVPGKPYRFTDQDRARSAEARERRYVQSALTCDACDARGACPAFEKGSICGLDPVFKRLATRNADECVAKIKEIISVMEERAWRNLYFENLMRGGKPIGRVTKLFKKLIEQHLLLMRLYQELAPGRETVILMGGTAL